MQNSDLTNFFQSLCGSYSTLFPDLFIPSFEIIFTSSLNQTHLELRPDLSERLLNDIFDDSNGRTVFPRYVGDIAHILLNINHVEKSIEDGSMTFLGTFAHELTHIIDYFEMATKEDVESYDSLIETSHNLMFCLWSEYHAKKNGYAFLRHILQIDSSPTDKEMRVKFILDTELPFQIEYFNKEYHFDNEGINQMYWTMQFLGRVSVWCDLFPEVFNHEMLESLFLNNQWLLSIFLFLREHETIESVYSNFEKMRDVLRKNWSLL